MASHRRRAIVLPAIVALLALAPADGRAVELAQNAPITAAPKLVLPPNATLPDLWAAPIHVKLDCMVKTNSMTATIKVLLKNNNKVDADLTKHPWHHIVTARVAKVTPVHTKFDGNLNQIVTSPGAGPAILKGGESAQTTITLTNIPRSHYPYRFEIIVDPDNLVAESNEKNNFGGKDVQNICPL
jgi:hypothetical protein